MKLKIKVTKEILETTKLCGDGNKWCDEEHIQSNCAISVACQDIFPGCSVGRASIKQAYLNSKWFIELPEVAKSFIQKFDHSSPEDRILMPEFEFEVELTDEVLEFINIEEAREALKNSTTLELIEV